MPLAELLWLDLFPSLAKNPEQHQEKVDEVKI
jgi:hypothetical protein